MTPSWLLLGGAISMDLIVTYFALGLGGVLFGAVLFGAGILLIASAGRKVR